MRSINRRNMKIPFTILLVFLLFLNTLVRTKIDFLHGLGEFSTNVSFILMSFYLLKNWLDMKRYETSLTKIYISMILFMVVFIFSYFLTDYANGYYFIRVLLLLFLILGFARYKWNDIQVKVIGYILGIVTIMLFIHWMVLGLPAFGYESVFRNQNYLAVLLFSMLYFNFLTIKYSTGMERVLFVTLTSMNLLLMLMTSARSVLIGMTVVILSWIILKQYKKIFPYLIFIVLLGNALFMAIYVGIRGTFIGDAMNQLSRTMFNKNLFSGRSELWEGLVQAIADKPWFGYGIGVSARQVMETNYTAHNLYLQILLESGIIGMVAFLLLILSIWQVLNKQLDKFTVKWSACFMLGILVYESFELTLFQNNYSISMFQWLIITFGINFFATELETRLPFLGKQSGLN